MILGSGPFLQDVHSGILDYTYLGFVINPKFFFSAYPHNCDKTWYFSGCINEGKKWLKNRIDWLMFKLLHC